MYAIIKDGEQIAITEKLNYITQNKNGVFVSSTESDAQGVAVNNIPYNIAGRGKMADCESVVIFEIDGGRCIETGNENQHETDTLVVDHEYRLTLLELGVTENVI